MIRVKQFLFLITLVFLMVGCNNVPQKRPGIAYPDMISPLYYLDTIQIKDPRVVYIDSVAYITSQAILDSVSSFDLINTKGVVLYYTGRSLEETDYINIYDYRFNSLSGLLTFTSHYDIKMHLDFTDRIDSYAVYRFKIKPESFLLTLVADDVTIEHVYDIITGCSFSNKYELAMCPIYSKKDWRVILKREIGREPGWEYSLPRWAHEFYESCRHRIEEILR